MNIEEELEQAGKFIMIASNTQGRIALLKPLRSGEFCDILSGIIWKNQPILELCVDWVIKYGDRCQMSDDMSDWVDVTYQGVSLTSGYTYISRNAKYKHIRPITSERLEARANLDKARSVVDEAVRNLKEAREAELEAFEDFSYTK